MDDHRATTRPPLTRPSASADDQYYHRSIDVNTTVTATAAPAAGRRGRDADGIGVWDDSWTESNHPRQRCAARRDWDNWLAPDKTPHYIIVRSGVRTGQHCISPPLIIPIIGLCSKAIFHTHWTVVIIVQTHWTCCYILLFYFAFHFLLSVCTFSRDTCL